MKTFLQNEDGATAIEYGLLASIIGSVLVSITMLFGDGLGNGFNALSASFANRAAF